jgi:NADPH:quinone reductase-like Zn-dependent oxidoreductase
MLEDLPDPEPGPGQVLVDVRAAGINFPDLLMIQGLYQEKLDPPFVPGGEAAGVVSAVGDGVTEFAPGDPVMLTTASDAGRLPRRRWQASTNFSRCPARCRSSRGQDSSSPTEPRTTR